MLDAPLRKVARKILDKFGTSVIIRRVTGTAYNTSTRTMTPTTADTTVNGRLDEYTDREMASALTNQERPPIKSGDRKLTVAANALAFTPAIADRAVVASVVYKVLWVTSHLATDEAAIFELQLRR